MSKDARYRKLINSKRWKVLRLQKLQAQPLCECCHKKHIITLATEVHHIVPVESVSTEREMILLMFDFDNLMSLCHECHAEIHKEMFSHTKENVIAANRKRTHRFIDKYLS
jgi:5-methylcytosine-specific restriction protein A